MNKITYTPGGPPETHHTPREQMLAAAKAVEGKARKRILYPTDASDLLRVLDEHPDCKTARSYSRDGFVANAYGYSAKISFAEATRNEDGSFAIAVRRASAQRSRGQGPLLTVNNRAV